MGGKYSGKPGQGHDNPGPIYDIDVNKFKPNAPSTGFGKAGRGGVKGSDGPGPGNYNSYSNLGKGGYKMGGRHNARKGDDGPGPGQYSSDI